MLATPHELSLSRDGNMQLVCAVLVSHLAAPKPSKERQHRRVQAREPPAIPAGYRLAEGLVMPDEKPGVSTRWDHPLVEAFQPFA